jgi:hypothetical protein
LLVEETVVSCALIKREIVGSVESACRVMIVTPTAWMTVLPCGRGLVKPLTAVTGLAMVIPTKAVTPMNPFMFLGQSVTITLLT